jgi:cell division protein FtsZ
LRGVLDGASMVFLCVGLGGGTGSGAAPLIANLARQQHAIVIAFATLPFGFEGRRRLAQAEEALASLTQQADVVICFENDRMGDSVSPRAGIQEAFSAADHTISQSVRALAAILSRRGLIQAGFDEIAATLRAQQPRSLFGFGEADGDNRAHTALERALRNPLMDRGRLLGDAHRVLVHIAGGPSMTLNEVTLLMDELNRHISDHTQIFFSTAVDPKLGGKITVTLLSSLEAGQPTAIERPAPRIMQEEVPKPAPAPAPARPEPESDLLIAEKRAPVQTDASPVQEEPPAVAASATEAAPAAASSRKTSAKPVKTKPVREEKQEQMLFEPVNRGRFEKSEPTIVDGQDLDVPTFMRVNVRVK